MISIIRYWLTFVVLCLYGLLVGCREEANNHIHFSTGEHLLSTPAIYMTSQIDNTLNTPPSLTIVADSAPTLTPLPEPSLTPVGTPLAVPEKPLDGGWTSLQNYHQTLLEHHLNLHTSGGRRIVRSSFSKMSSVMKHGSTI